MERHIVRSVERISEDTIRVHLRRKPSFSGVHVDYMDVGKDGNPTYHARLPSEQEILYRAGEQFILTPDGETISMNVINDISKILKIIIQEFKKIQELINELL